MITYDEILATAKESLTFWLPKVRLVTVHTWALLANEDGESSFKPRPLGDKVNGEFTAFGPFQWHSGRADVLMLPPPKGCGIDVRDASHLQQLEAAYFEMNHVDGYRHVWTHLMATETIVDAVTVLVREFERSGNQPRDIAKRTQLALHWEATLSPLAAKA